VRFLGRAYHWITVGVVLAASVALIAFGNPTVPIRKLAILDIDPYPLRTEITACANPIAPKPAVAEFRHLILSQVGGTDDGIAVCKYIANGEGVYSDHADGRAWDWHEIASSARDRARVDRVLNWLLRTDERGNRNAMARRIGITYIIWNHLYYRVGDDDAHWVPYHGTSDPHDTHVHFSFSVAGATQQTSWWSERGPLTWTLDALTDVSLTFGTGPARPVPGDWDGNGHDSVGVYNPANRRFSVRNGLTSGAADLNTPPIGPFGAIPFSGNWGRGGDELGVYDPMTRQFSFYSVHGAQVRPTRTFGAPGDLPIIGDWNGDGVDDIGTYTPATTTFTMLWPDGSVVSKMFGQPDDTPLVGDWNGDGVDEIGTFRPTDHTFYFDTASGPRAISYGTIRTLPVVGDWNGDGSDTPGIVKAS
jgi:hypothetical protein